MFETKSELDTLQTLLDRSYAAAGPHLRGIVTPERRLTARQVATYLEGIRHVALATVTRAAEPIVAPLDGWFLHGRFIVSTGANAARVSHLRRNPAVSLAHVNGDDVGIWAHGSARIATRGDPLVDEYSNVATRTYGSDPLSWGDIAVLVVDARAMFAYAHEPSKFPESRTATK
jgi:Pyridoxamine 5'-phosphate oxidase